MAFESLWFTIQQNQVSHNECLFYEKITDCNGLVRARPFGKEDSPGLHPAPDVFHNMGLARDLLAM